MLHLMANFLFVNWILVNAFFFMYICKCSIMPFLYVLFVKILSYVEEIKNIYLSIYLLEKNKHRGSPCYLVFFQVGQI